MKQELMIIDDDEASRFLLRERIARLGYTYEVYETINGQEAIEFLLDYESKLTTEGVKEQVCLLIFLDINNSSSY